MRLVRLSLLVFCLALMSVAAFADTESFTIGNPGDYTSVFQVLGGGFATTDFFLFDSNGSEWGGDATGTAAALSANFNLDTTLSSVPSQGTVLFTLNLNGTIAAVVSDTNGSIIVGFGYDSTTANLPESNFSPLLPQNAFGWIDSFGYHPSGFLAGTTPSTPEPGTLVLLGTGALGLLGSIRRKLL